VITRLAIGGLGAVGLAVASCGDRDDGAAVQELAVIADEAGDPAVGRYRFELPGRVPAGPTRISLTNNGHEPHHAQLFKLAEDRTAADLATALASGGETAAAEYGTFAGGTAVVDAGETSNAEAVANLTAGVYVLICSVEGPDRDAHHVHGMLRPFLVVDDAGGRLPPPPSDLDVDVSDDEGFALPESIAGDSVLAVTNNGATEPRQITVERLDDGATADDILTALDRGAPPPTTPVGGLQRIPPATTQMLQLDLEPGKYVMVADDLSPDGTPHLTTSAIEEVTVR
jgi:hypothetical protein